MSVAAVGSEASDQTILAKIKNSLERNKDQDIVEIKFTTNELKKVSVCEAINAKYDAEIVDDTLFIKFDGGNKEEIHRQLANSFYRQFPNWFATCNMICMVGGNQLRPDIGVWYQKPTHAERNEPVANNCPPSDIWFEVFFNQNSDRSNAINKVSLITKYWTGIEFVGIAIPKGQPYQQNPNPQAAITAAIAKTIRPYKAPYVIYWDINNNPVYYKIKWNQNLMLRCGFTIDFNIILTIISDP